MPVAIAKMFGSRITSSGAKPAFCVEQVVRAVGDRDLALDRVGLALLVERHHDGAAPYGGRARRARGTPPRPP
jgi:hypothetical protein